MEIKVKHIVITAIGLILGIAVSVIFGRNGSFLFLVVLLAIFGYLFLKIIDDISKSAYEMEMELHNLDKKFYKEIRLLCPYCDTKVTFRDSICPKCKANLNGIPLKKAIRCHNCHSFRPSDERVCPICGSQINNDNFD